MTPLNLSRPAHLDREARMIRIEALQAVNFKSQITRDWDEMAREAVEGETKFNRCQTQPKFGGE